MTWPAVRLGDLCSLITKGTTPRTLGREYSASGIAFLRAENLNNGEVVLDENTLFIDEDTDELLARSRILPSDVLVSIAGTIGRVAIVRPGSPRMNCNQAVAIVRISGPLDARFLLHWLQTPNAQAQIKGRQVTATISNLSLGQIGELRVPLPPLLEQRRIVEILDQAESLGRLRRQADRTLDRILPAMFVKLFGDPIRNAIGWPLVPISSFVSSMQGGKNMLSESGEPGASKYYILKISAVTSTEYDPNECKPLPNTFVPPPHYLVREGDLLFSRANTTSLVGASAYVFDTPDNRVLPDKIWRFIWREPRTVEPLFIWFLMKNPSIRYEVGKLATGTSGSMKNISMGKLLTMRIPLPPLPLQQRFAAAVRSIRETHETRINSSVSLERLWSILVQRAFSTSLTVRWRQQHLKEIGEDMAQQATWLSTLQNGRSIGA